MNRVWVFFASLFVIIFLIPVFRWQSFTLSNKPGYKEIMLKDRLSGQLWVKRTGYFNGELLSEAESPRFSYSEISKLQRIIAMNNGLEKELAQQANYEKFLAEREKKIDIALEKINSKGTKPSAIDGFVLSIELEKRGVIPYAQKTYQDLDTVKYRIQKLNERARYSAVKELNRRAVEKRQVYNEYWIIALAACFVLSLCSYILGKRIAKIKKPLKA